MRSSFRQRVGPGAKNEINSLRSNYGAASASPEALTQPERVCRRKSRLAPCIRQTGAVGLDLREVRSTNRGRFRRDILMADHMSHRQRRALMARIRQRDTRPELRVRHLVHRMGFRYRLHRRDLPGTPDLTFPRLAKVILVHGCFWHQHDCPRGSRPKSNTEFWDAKLQKNILRDQNNISLLRRQGWSVMVVWECETRDLENLQSRLRAFLSAPS